MANTGARLDPYAAFNFTLDIDGLTGVHGFSECTGANSEQDVIEYREGTMDITVIKIPGLKKFGDITLKRGFTTSQDLWLWRKTAMDGSVVRRGGHLVLRDEAGRDALRWKFTNAWPKKYSAPAFNAKTNEVAVEELVLAVEGLELEKPTS
ncbi:MULTISPECIES: phage tail protein [Kitasatospora]|jgi:phage tail-like protein|uniref:Phage tail protein n=1 Tax=Kitasatospora acidiphila TaxID=2567942 RepID=A0A540WCU9_9ACTN|nr:MULTISPECIES: phage tail protein [Kitasatospora]MDH6143528.1 phage tail-like protein [Kitasatospora sp. GP30]TQF06861.1 phage tail protein [Kitasatospora acidiphila]